MIVPNALGWVNPTVCAFTNWPERDNRRLDQNRREFMGLDIVDGANVERASSVLGSTSTTSASAALEGRSAL